MVRTACGLCWAACANTRIKGLNLDEMMWQMADQAPGLFGYTIHSAKCTLKFRYLYASTLDGLQQLIRSSPW